MTKRYVQKVLSIILIICIVFFNNIITFAAKTTIEVKPEQNQYFELRAVDVKETDENGKQVIMELWGHDIVFQRI